MKLATALALSYFLVAAEAFGPAKPLRGNAFGVSASNNGMTMRIGTSDMARKIRFNNVLKEVGNTGTKEAVESTLLSDDVSSLIKSSNWKIRKSYIRKVRGLAGKFEVDVPAGFGVPPSQAEREAAEIAAGAQRKVDREAFLQKLSEEVQAAKQARAQQKAEKKARKEAAPSPAKKVKEAPAAAASAPVPAADAPEPPAAAAALEEPKPAAGGDVTPATIKQLRDATGAGMMDCKKALLECDGNQEAASEYLRKKGLAKADKKAARVAAEGKIVVTNSGNKAVLIEVNCETDFVGKDSSFLAYCDRVASAAINVDDDNIETLMAMEVDGETLESTRQALVAKIGENIQVRRLASRGSEGSTIGAYIHMNRIGVLVELEGGSEELATDVAMHVAAMNPPFAVPEDVPGDVIDKEKKVLSEQALESGKPAEIVEKMVEGRIRKYLEEICLVSQNYVKDSGMTVGKLLEENGAKMIGFSRIAVGEGIEKKEDDFAAEVAKMAGKA